MESKDNTMVGDYEEINTGASTSAANKKYHPDAIWASSIDIIDNAEEIRDQLEEYWFNRFFETSLEMPLPALENEQSCIVEKSCGLVAAKHLGHVGHCTFHLSINSSLLFLTNGSLCTVENCTKRVCASMSKEYCFTHVKRHKKSITNDPIEYDPELAILIGEELAEDLYQETLKHPKRRHYIGITIQDFADRLNRHQHQDYTQAKIVKTVDNIWLLRDIEYEFIRRYSEKVGTKYLRNKEAGGIYGQTDMNQPGIVYVLSFDDEVDPDPSVIGPKRNFDIRNFSKYFPRQQPKFTPMPSLKLPLFRDNFHRQSKELLKKLGYEIRKSSHEKAKEGTGKFKCDKCDYSSRQQTQP
ncbi:hypothetical protein PVAND_016130 [Polypedilum vanderplanki]|uniref:Uncharacterized protein n=1 Tax=Polypedilum vanderplanki TaxID=319348 RepID=A0A9J6BE83_POLVA|nr:hypothetical protein PVAND_016130 [Polypedilum vanderplanki]